MAKTNAAKICVSDSQQPSKTQRLSLVQARAVDDEIELLERALKAIDISRNQRQATVLLTYLRRALLESARALQEQSIQSRTLIQTAYRNNVSNCFAAWRAWGDSWTSLYVASFLGPRNGAEAEANDGSQDEDPKSKPCAAAPGMGGGGRSRRA